MSVSQFCCPLEWGEAAGDVTAEAEGNVLKITVMWPSVLTDVQMLNAMWLQGDGVPNFEDYHPHVQGFYNYLEQFHQREKRRDRIVRTYSPSVCSEA